MNKRATFIIVFFLAIIYNLYAQDNFNPQKLSGFLCKLINSHSEVKSRNYKEHQKTFVTTLLKKNGRVNIQTIADDYGINIIDSINNIYFARIPIKSLARLSFDNRVIKIEADEAPKPLMNYIPQRIGADKAWQGMSLPQAYTGEGVICAIYDISWDFTNPMFYDDNGNLRILKYFAMENNDEDGSVIWKEYDTEDLKEMQYSESAQSHMHGTHVSSIMAGSNVSGKKDDYCGIAPKSEIVVTELLTGKTTTADVVLNLKHIFDYAESQEKPCVINMSAGSYFPITAPTAIYDEVFQGLIKPGHIIVAAAGNKGSYNSTFSKPEYVNQASCMIIPGSNYDNSKSYDFYVESKNSITIEYYFISGERHSLSINTNKLDELDGQPYQLFDNNNYYSIEAYKDVEASKRLNNNIYCFNIKAYISLFNTSRKNVFMNPIIKITGDSQCKLYTNPNLFSFIGVKFNPKVPIDEQFEFNSDYCTKENTIEWPAMCKNVIAVGALDTKENFENIQGNVITEAPYSGSGLLAEISAWGPTWDGRNKPDVVAPGVFVMGAYNYWFDWHITNSLNNYLVKYVYDELTAPPPFGEDEDSPYEIVAASGTSMACPVVAGAIALWLQAKPDLTEQEIIDILAHTCSHPDQSLDYPNIQYGYGEIDVYKGLHYLLHTNINELSSNQPLSLSFKIENEILIINDTKTGNIYEGSINVIIYTIDGKKIVTSNSSQIELHDIPKGIYAVQVNTGNQETTGSTLISIK